MEENHLNHTIPNMKMKNVLIQCNMGHISPGIAQNFNQGIKNGENMVKYNKFDANI